LVFGTATILTRRIVYEMLGWLLHILIDIPTHSFGYYALDGHCKSGHRGSPQNRP